MQPLLRLASDERLVALVRGGDDAAFEALYDRHHGALLAFCRHMLGSREEAEDALQHTFLAAYRDLLASTKPIDLRPWLFAIARNRCRTLLRARREHLTLAVHEPSTDGLTVTVEHREAVRELLADLARLPEDQRAALLLAQLGQLDHAGIAVVLGCRREKVKALVYQARSSLVASQSARMTSCADIRAELATASGGVLRRAPLRHHLRTCAGCRAFKDEIVAQRRLLALALPVVPGVALKAGALAASGGGAGAWGAGIAGGELLTTGAAKLAVSLALVGTAVGGGAVAVDAVGGGGDRQHQNRRASVASVAAGAVPIGAVPALLPAASVRRTALRRAARAPSSRARREPAGAREPAAPSPAPSAPPSQPAVQTAPGGAPRSVGLAPPSPGGNAPERGAGGPPGQSGGGPPGRTGAGPPGQSGAGPPGQRRDSPPGNSGAAPGHAGGGPPGQTGAGPPGQSGDGPPGNSGNAPGHAGGGAPGQSAEGPPGQAGAGPPGHSGDGPSGHQR